MQVRKLEKLLKQHKVTTLEQLPDGAHADGGGLYLLVRGGSRIWQFRYKLPGQKARKSTLMPLADLPVAEARAQAAALYETFRQGRDPFGAAQAKAPVGAMSEFRTFAHYVLGLRGFKNDKVDPVTGEKTGKTRKAWIYTIDVVCEKLHGKQLADIMPRHVVDTVKPIWKTTPSVARQTLNCLRIVFQNAGGAFNEETGYPADRRNPAELKLIEQSLQKLATKGSIRKSHVSLDYSLMPKFWCELRARDTVASKALQVLILTCLRTNEALKATFDGEGDRRLVIPGKVMKHRDNIDADIPLTDTVRAIIADLKAHAPAGQKLIFSAEATDTKLGDSTLHSLVQKYMGYDGVRGPKATPHGFRATFVGYCRDKTAIDRETRQYCLHHIEGSEAEQAYNSGTMFAKRLDALTQWEQYVTSEERRLAAAEVVELKVAA